MPRMKSEILENYIKISDKVGLTKLAEDSAELKKYKDDPEARVGSDDISTIEALYGVKPEGQEYSHCIMEQAHPNSVIIAPSYDKINGLVENNIERSQIMRNITLKPNEGNNTVPKYAHKELLMELVRIANEMDNRNKESLFKLADECLIELHKEAFEVSELSDFLDGKARDAGAIGEGALAGAGIGATVGGLVTAWTGAGILAGVPIGAATGAVAGALIAAFTKTEPQVKNVSLNAQEVSNQLKDLRSKIPEDEQFFKSIDASVAALADSANKYQATLNVLKDHILHGQKVDTDEQEMSDVTKKFLEDSLLIKKVHAEFNRRNAAGEFAKAKPGKAVTPLYWFIDDDIEDVEDALNALEEAIQTLEESTKENVGSVANKAHSSRPIQPTSVSQTSSKPAESNKPDSDGADFLKYIMK